MKKTIVRILRAGSIAVLCLGLASCDDPQIYGSIGISSYGGGGYYHGGPRMGGSISIGGRIY
jgi:hypothetical protein